MLKAYLIDLEIISQLKENDKLAIYLDANNKSKIIIDKHYYFNFISRWYYSYNREQCINYIEILINSIKTEKNKIIEKNNLDNINLLKSSLINSKSGFITLQSTYTGDSILVARIQLVINQIQTIILELEEILLVNNLSVNQIDEITNTSANTNFITSTRHTNSTNNIYKNINIDTHNNTIIDNN